LELIVNANNLIVSLYSAALPDGSLEVHSLIGEETISQLFEYKLEILVAIGDAIDDEKLVQTNASLQFTYQNQPVRTIHGKICGVRDSVVNRGATSLLYKLAFVPRAWLCTLHRRIDIYMEVTPLDIFKTVLERSGFVEGDDFEMRIKSTFPVREFVVQYKETDWSFLSRIAEYWGICFFFEHNEERDRLIFSDQNEGFRDIEGSTSIYYQTHLDDGSQASTTWVSEFESQLQVIPNRYIARDYNYRIPTVDLTRKAVIDETSGGDIVEYGEHYKTPEEGDYLAAVRAEELRCGRRVYTGESSVVPMRAGCTCTLEEHPRGDLELIVSHVRHNYQRNQAFSNTFQAVLKLTAYRPPRRTPKPRISGVVTGIIDAASKGQYAEIDAEGRYKVRFLFDTSDASDGQASRACRMAQPHSGEGFGMHFPLRPGTEVLITFIDGDPDRPIIASTVPNPKTASPVTGSNHARNIIRTGGGNEINIDDTEGDTRIKMTVPHADTTFQLGAPNNPEQGAALSTAENWTAYAGQTSSTISKTSAFISEISALSSSKDITAFAGISNVISKIDSAAKILTAGGALITDIAGAPKKMMAPETARIRRLEDQKKKELDAANQALATFVNSNGSIDSALAVQEFDAAKANLERVNQKKNATQQEKEDAQKAFNQAQLKKVSAEEQGEKKLEIINKQLSYDIAKNNTAARLAEVEGILGESTNDGEVVRAATMLGSVASTAGALLDEKTRKAGKTLWSLVTKNASAATQSAAVIASQQALVAAKASGKGGRMSSISGIVKSPSNIQAAMGSSITYSAWTSALLGKNATVYGSIRTHISSRVATTLQSPRTEISGENQMWMTSRKEIDIKSFGTMKLHSDKACSLISKETMDIQVTKKLSIDGEDEMLLKMAKKVEIDIKEKLDVKVTNSFNSTAKSFEYKAEDSMDLFVKDWWGMKAKENSVSIGTKGRGLEVTDQMAKIFDNSSNEISVTGSKAAIKSATIEVASTGSVEISGKTTVKVTANNKVLLG
jgi:type VI secretion system VgrG family protein